MKQEFEHTPGPWKNKSGRIVKQDHTPTKKDPYDFTIAQVACFCSGEWQGDEMKANAELISAAPDLLVALIDMLENGDAQARKMARAAIRKAGVKI